MPCSKGVGEKFVHQPSLRHFGIHSWSSSTMLFQCQLTCPQRRNKQPDRVRFLILFTALHIYASWSACEHPGTAAEAAGVQEGEEVEAEGPGQQAGEVCGLQGEPSAHAEAQKHQLLGGTAQHKVLQHRPPLAVGPPVKLRDTKGRTSSRLRRAQRTSLYSPASHLPTLPEGFASLQTPETEARKVRITLNCSKGTTLRVTISPVKSTTRTVLATCSNALI